MIINPQICCYRFSLNRHFYLKVINNGTLLIQVILQYSLYTGTVTKDSGIIHPGGTARVSFHDTATNICFNVLNESCAEKPILYHGSISVIKTTCYEVYGTAENPTCMNVSC